MSFLTKPLLRTWRNLEHKVWRRLHKTWVPNAPETFCVKCIQRMDGMGSDNGEIRVDHKAGPSVNVADAKKRLRKMTVKLENTKKERQQGDSEVNIERKRRRRSVPRKKKRKATKRTALKERLLPSLKRKRAKKNLKKRQRASLTSGNKNRKLKRKTPLEKLNAQRGERRRMPKITMKNMRKKKTVLEESVWAERILPLLNRNRAKRNLKNRKRASLESGNRNRKLKRKTPLEKFKLVLQKLRRGARLRNCYSN